MNFYDPLYLSFARAASFELPLGFFDVRMRRMPRPLGAQVLKPGRYQTAQVELPRESRLGDL